MSLCHETNLRRVVLRTCIAVCTALLLSTTLLAQEEPAPKWDLFVGYQWLNPGITVPQPFSPFNNPGQFNVPSMGKGFGSSATYNFSRHWGLEGDFGHNWNDSGYETTGSLGPRLAFRTDQSMVFLHTLVSYNRLNVNGLNADGGVGAILGGGMDLSIVKRLSWRMFEADYVWANHNFSKFAAPEFSDLRRPQANGVRLRTGLVFNFGEPEAKAPAAAACSLQPTEVMVGEPITANVNATNFNPKHTLVYNWSSNGGKITGNNTTAAIDTNGVAGGSYTVTARVSDPKAKSGGEASCTANFTVKEVPKNPPTMSCSANPTSVQTGAPVTVTCSCTSLDNVPVTVSGWTSTGGTISGSGNTATLNTTGASPGTITVNATCTDSRGLSASSSAQATVENPPPPPPQASKLSECDFPNKVKPWRVDNTCKAVLDDVAQRLQHDPDSKLVIVGNSDPAEKRKNLAAERAVNSKFYLAGGEAKQAIDASRIETRTGSAGTTTAEYWVVPAGASFTGTGTAPVDENVIKNVPDHPKPAAKKAAAKKGM